MFLSSASTAPTTLQIFVDMAKTNPKPFVSQLTTLKQTAVQQPVMLGPVAAIVGAVGKMTQVNGYNRYMMTLSLDTVMFLFSIESCCRGYSDS